MEAAGNKPKLIREYVGRVNSDTEGVSDTTIKIGASLPLSGTYADAGNLGKAIEFLFTYYNDQGLFKDASNGKTRKSASDSTHAANCE